MGSSTSASGGACGSRSCRAGQVSLERKLDFLGRAASYRGNPASVHAIETHLSWVFIAGDRVLKLKKPLRLEFLDFSTLALREHDCREELRLNRRLAPDVYLGVRALLLREDGSLAIADADPPDTAGTVVEWLVHMRRLPADRMLDAAIRAGCVTLEDVDRVGAVLARFYRGLEPCAIAPEEFVARFAREQRYNRAVLTRPVFALDGWRGVAALDRVDRALQALRPALAQRAAGGHVVEGHGDLRPEHVCLVDPPAIIDCLEFDRTLRLVDPAEELAFLGLECEMEGAAWIEPRLARSLHGIAGMVPEALRDFYRAHRALVRARLALAHLLEPSPRQPARWVPLARRYVELALAVADGLGDQPAR